LPCVGDSKMNTLALGENGGSQLWAIHRLLFEGAPAALARPARRSRRRHPAGLSAAGQATAYPVAIAPRGRLEQSIIDLSVRDAELLRLSRRLSQISRPPAPGWPLSEPHCGLRIVRPQRGKGLAGCRPAHCRPRSHHRLPYDGHPSEAMSWSVGGETMLERIRIGQYSADAIASTAKCRTPLAQVGLNSGSAVPSAVKLW
jgi:hypothetical protein